MDHELRTLTARLLAERALPRTDPLVRRALVDEGFRQDLEQRLAAVGLHLLDNPYAGHVAVALVPEVHEPVFGAGREYGASNLGLKRDEIALLVILWALIILPKRERQLTRHKLEDHGQDDMFGYASPMPQGESVSAPISETSLLADFAVQLGGRHKLTQFLLPRLARLGFIERRGGMIHEGPLLDVLLDYRVLADRIIHGTLAAVLAQAGLRAPTVPEQEDIFEDDADPTPEGAD